MVLLKFIEQIVNMFPDVVQRRRDRPLDCLLIADFLWSDLFSLHIIQKLFFLEFSLFSAGHCISCNLHPLGQNCIIESRLGIDLPQFIDVHWFP